MADKLTKQGTMALFVDFRGILISRPGPRSPLFLSVSPELRGDEGASPIPVLRANPSSVCDFPPL